MKRFCILYMVGLAFLIISCSQDDNLDGNKNLNFEDGQKTWAFFSFDISGSQTTSRATSEDAKDGEKSVVLATIYVFREDDTFEISSNVTLSLADYTTGTDENPIPAMKFELTSGKKKVVVILNDNRVAVRNLKSGVAGLLAAVESPAYPSSLFSSFSSPVANMLMTGHTTITLAANITPEQAEHPNNNNHIEIAVDRVAAKLDVRANDMTVYNKSNLLGTLVPINYSVLNLHSAPFTFLHEKDNKEVIVSNNYANIIPDGGSVSSHLYHTSASTIMDNKSYRHNVLAKTDDSFNIYGQDMIFVPENTNLLPQVGNSTYVFLKGTYQPSDNVEIPTYHGTYAQLDPATNRITPNARLEEPADSKAAMYSYDYDFTFQPIAATSLDDTQLKQLIAHHIVNSGVMGTNFTIDEISNTIPASIAIGEERYVYRVIDQSASVMGKTCSNIAVVRYVQGETAPVIDDSFKVDDLTVGFYQWDRGNKGLICYYRINIFDDSYEPTHPMYFSVIRNNVYHVEINGINSIGYPVASDVEVNPSTPLTESTNLMDVHIKINQWSGK